MIASGALIDAANVVGVKVFSTDVGTVNVISVQFAPNAVDAAFSSGGNVGSVALLIFLGYLVAMTTNYCTNWTFFVLFFDPLCILL